MGYSSTSGARCEHRRLSSGWSELSSTYDVIVVGGGFAGIVGARELRKAGYRVVVLEARDRLGGRTWTSEFAGVPVELGGAWVHWHQPHIWAELSRYGLGVVEYAGPTTAGWIVDGELRSGSVERVETLASDVATRLLADSHRWFEKPFDPFAIDFEEIDGTSVADGLAALRLDAESRDVGDSLFASVCSAHCDEVSVAVFLREQALAGFDVEAWLECLERFSIATGTKSLVDAIAADGGFDLRLGAAVAALEQGDRGVMVRTRGGEPLEARAAIVAVPVNTLADIEFAPLLTDGKRAMAREGQASHGLKTWFRVRGEVSYLGQAPSNHALTVLSSVHHVDGDTLFVAFGPDAAVLDPTDAGAVAIAVQDLMPGYEVLEVHAHDWTADEFSQGTWSAYRPNQLTRYLRELQKPEGRIVLAGSDLATGWSGAIDGAIESGLRAAHQIRQILAV